jgi:hypothetical protein
MMMIHIDDDTKFIDNDSLIHPKHFEVGASGV